MDRRVLVRTVVLMHGLVYGVIRVVREFMVNCLTWMQTPSVSGSKK